MSPPQKTHHSTGDGYWRIIVEEGAEYNFIYLLPKKDGEPQKVMVPSQLVMGWTESAAFFTKASQGAADLSDIIIDEPDTLHQLGPHPLEHHALPPIFHNKRKPNDTPDNSPTPPAKRTKPNPPPLTDAALVDRLLTVL